MISRELLAIIVVGFPAFGAGLVGVAPRAFTRQLAVGAAVATFVVALTLALVTLTNPTDPYVSASIVVDTAAGLFVGVIALVGMASVCVSSSYLDSVSKTLVRDERSERVYYSTLLVFWALLFAIPLAGNLPVAWLLIGGTTAASALLIGFGGKARALEAGWKYLILTSLGLGFALLGIIMLAAGIPEGGLDTLTWQGLSSYTGGVESALVAYILLIGGLAAKIGWAPVHNWLPDAHSEAPPPVSALLSAALLPVVLLVAWRSELSLAPVIGKEAATGVLIGFGLVSLAFAVPFLWRPLAWKRLLAYSSLEHMGVIALGVGFGSPLAIAGVAIHIFGHAIAKALGFYAATPLLVHDRRASGHAVTGIARTQQKLGATMGLSLGTLAGLPPLPLFASEVLIIAGGFQTGRGWAAAAAAVLLALGFLGLAYALIEVTVGKESKGRRVSLGLRELNWLAAISLVLLFVLTSAVLWLPGTDVIAALVKGIV